MKVIIISLAVLLATAAGLILGVAMPDRAVSDTAPPDPFTGPIVEAIGALIALKDVDPRLCRGILLHGGQNERRGQADQLIFRLRQGSGIDAKYWYVWLVHSPQPDVKEKTLGWAEIKISTSPESVTFKGGKVVIPRVSGVMTKYDFGSSEVRAAIESGLGTCRSQIEASLERHFRGSARVLNSFKPTDAEHQ